MLEVARRCQGCGIEIRDLYDGKEEERDRPLTRRERVVAALETAALVVMVVIIASLATIGCATLWFTTAFTWPWLPWA